MEPASNGTKPTSPFREVESAFSQAYRSLTRCFRSDDVSKLQTKIPKNNLKKERKPFFAKKIRSKESLSASVESGKIAINKKTPSDSIESSSESSIPAPAPSPKKLKERVFSDQTHRFPKDFTAAKEAIRDGLLARHEPVVNKGACASRIYKNKDNEGVGIFKDLNPKDLSFKRTAEIAFKKFFNIRRPTELLPGKSQKSKAFAEKLAYDLDQFLDLHIVPPTDFMDRPGDQSPENVGTFQLFVKDYEEAAVKFSQTTNIPTSKELDLFQKLPFFDYLIGGVDCHDENWMVKLDAKDGRLKSIANIDNGNAFIERNPTSFDRTILKNQYQWGEHPYSKEKFTKATVDFVQNLDEAKLVNFLKQQKETYAKHPNPDIAAHAEVFFSDEMINGMLERLAVLKHTVHQFNTPQELSRIKTDEQIQANMYPVDAAKKQALSILASHNIAIIKNDVQSLQKQMEDLSNILGERIETCKRLDLKDSTQSILEKRKSECDKVIKQMKRNGPIKVK